MYMYICLNHKMNFKIYLSLILETIIVCISLEWYFGTCTLFIRLHKASWRL